MKEKSITEQTARSKQDSQQCPSQEDWKAAINLKGGPLVGEIAEALLRIVVGEDLESFYSSLLEKVAKLFASLVRRNAGRFAPKHVSRRDVLPRDVY